MSTNRRQLTFAEMVAQAKNHTDKRYYCLAKDKCKHCNGRGHLRVSSGYQKMSIVYCSCVIKKWSKFNRTEKIAFNTKHEISTSDSHPRSPKFVHFRTQQVNKRY